MYISIEIKDDVLKDGILLAHGKKIFDLTDKSLTRLLRHPANREKINVLAKIIRPVIEIEGVYRFVDSKKIHGENLFFDEQGTDTAGKLERIAEISTYHEGWYNFKPNVAEVIYQIPEGIIHLVRAFESREIGKTKIGGHEARTTLYM